MEPLLTKARNEFHKNLLESVLTIKNGVPSNADKDQKSSVAFANGIAERLQIQTGERLKGQTSGNEFERYVTEYIEKTFALLKHLRPGDWRVFQIKGRQNRSYISQFTQYQHLRLLRDFIQEHRNLEAILGNDYAISPDIIVARGRVSDSELNKHGKLVDDKVSKNSDLLLQSGSSEFLHASISTKWTLRSDRAQNARSEALNLIRNRKGRLPHIMVVTGEPTPSRLSSLALGTGDIDCLYHFALYELQDTIRDSGNDEALNMLKIMIEGNRLKDISDLPLDLAV